MGIAKEICRIEKIKSVGALGGAYQHNLRLKDITNADETKTSYNIELTGRLPQKSYVDCFQDMIHSSPWYENGNHKIAKNAVYAVEFMLTFGGEAKGKIDIDSWCYNNIKWLSAHFGGPQNIISAILHMDERTPHIHAIVIPLDEKGKLNYTKYLGGSKYRLSELQDSYHEEVGQFHNLDREMKGSKARHQDIDNFYSMINETASPVKLPEPEQKTGLFKKGETAVEYQENERPVKNCKIQEPSPPPQPTRQNHPPNTSQIKQRLIGHSTSISRNHSLLNSTTSVISQSNIMQISCNVFKVILLFLRNASSVPVLNPYSLISIY